MFIKANKLRLYIVAFFIILFVSLNTLVAEEIAIIVNATNKLDELSMADVEKIFKAERQFWSSGKKIRLIMRPMDSTEGRVLLEKIYNMPQEEFRLFWLEKVYGGHVNEPPKVIRSATIVNTLVGQIQGAIAPIEVDKVSKWARIKVIKIDGKMPGENGYPLNTKK